MTYPTILGRLHKRCDMRDDESREEDQTQWIVILQESVAGIKEIEKLNNEEEREQK